MTEQTVQRLKDYALLTRHDQDLLRQEQDAAYADFGRMVAKNLFDPAMVSAVCLAGLKAKSTIELVAMIRAFILTGAKP